MKGKRVLKKQILRLEYLEAEYEDCLEIHDEAKREFESSVRNLHYNLNVFDEDLDGISKKQNDFNESRQLNDTSIEDQKNKEKAPEWAKSLFRKIVKMTHPDKLSSDLAIEDKERLRETYQLVKEAIDKGDFAKIAMIANSLNIDLATVKISDFSKFKQKEASLQEAIEKIKKSIFWVWGTSTQDQKDRIMQEFLKSKGWTSQKSMLKKSRKKNHPGKSIKWARTISLKKDDEK